MPTGAFVGDAIGAIAGALHVGSPTQREGAIVVRVCGEKQSVLLMNAKVRRLEGSRRRVYAVSTSGIETANSANSIDNYPVPYRYNQ